MYCRKCNSFTLKNGFPYQSAIFSIFTFFRQVAQTKFVQLFFFLYNKIAKSGGFLTLLEQAEEDSEFRVTSRFRGVLAALHLSEFPIRFISSCVHHFVKLMLTPLLWQSFGKPIKLASHRSPLLFVGSNSVFMYDLMIHSHFSID